MSSGLTQLSQARALLRRAVYQKTKLKTWKYSVVSIVELNSLTKVRI